MRVRAYVDRLVETARAEVECTQGRLEVGVAVPVTFVSGDGPCRFTATLRADAALLAGATAAAADAPVLCQPPDGASCLARQGSQWHRAAVLSTADDTCRVRDRRVHYSIRVCQSQIVGYRYLGEKKLTCRDLDSSCETLHVTKILYCVLPILSSDRYVTPVSIWREGAFDPKYQF